MPTSKAKRDKGGQGKKNIKQDSKVEKEPDVETARVNAALWELKLKRTERDLSDSRRAHHNMACMNEELSSQLYRSEQDAIETTAYWLRAMAAKDDKIRNLEEDLQKQKELHLEEKNKMAQELERLQNEMRRMKAKEAELEDKLCDMREQMDFAQREYAEDRKRAEEDFLMKEENVKQETINKCNVRIAQLTVDHHEALTQVENALTSALQENDGLKETMRNMRKEAEDLKKLTNSLTEDKRSLVLEKEMLESVLKKNKANMVATEKKLSDALAKAASQEQDIEKMSKKHAQQEEKEQRSLITIQAAQIELDKLQQVLDLREKEMQQLKQLGRTILDKRKEVEEFFHNALDQVRREIVASRLQGQKEELQDYHQKFREATAGKINFPPIRAFHKNPKSSGYNTDTPSKWSPDLTWEQKEKVLTLVFAKMNGQIEGKASKQLVLCASCEKQKRLFDTELKCKKNVQK